MALVSEVQPELTVVVPVYNNADSLELLYQRIQKVFHDTDVTFELLFVNDAGLDNSLNILCEMVNQYAEVSLVKMRNNVGQHAAVFHGLRFARGQCCLIMDADLQDPPEALPSLLYARSSKHQAIFAGRRGYYQNLLRMMSSRVYKSLLHYLIGLPKDAGIFVLIEREMVEVLLGMPVAFPWINVMIGLSGLPLYVVPVKRQLRKKGASAYSTWGRLRSAARGLYCALSYRALSFLKLRSDKSYLERMEIDPVEWVKTGEVLK